MNALTSVQGKIRHEHFIAFAKIKVTELVCLSVVNQSVNHLSRQSRSKELCLIVMTSSPLISSKVSVSTASEKLFNILSPSDL